MNRRLAAKKLVIASASLITLPSWVAAITRGTSTHLTSFSGEEQQILASVVDTIIPLGNGIGALSVGVDKYFQKMIDDCYEKADQDKVKNGLLVLDEQCRVQHGQHFFESSQAQRQALLEQWSTSENNDKKEFFKVVKRETMVGFNTSQQVLEGYLHYKVAPGHYYGSVNVNA